MIIFCAFCARMLNHYTYPHLTSPLGYNTWKMEGTRMLMTWPKMLPLAFLLWWLSLFKKSSIWFGVLLKTHGSVFGMLWEVTYFVLQWQYPSLAHHYCLISKQVTHLTRCHLWEWKGPLSCKDITDWFSCLLLLEDAHRCYFNWLIVYNRFCRLYTSQWGLFKDY